jgi:hypothetical protein
MKMRTPTASFSLFEVSLVRLPAWRTVTSMRAAIFFRSISTSLEQVWFATGGGSEVESHCSRGLRGNRVHRKCH